MGHELEVMVADGAELGEGPVWDVAAQQLVWLDILRDQVHRFDPATGTNTTMQYGEPVTAMVPAASGGFVATVGQAVTRFQADGSARVLAEIPAGDRGNDGKCDPSGRYLVGTLTGDHTPGAVGLYRFDQPDRLVTVVLDVTLANGLDWSPSGDQLYFVDTVTERVDVFDYHPDGTATNRRSFADLANAPGRPDGLTVDAEGGVWVAVIRSGQLRRYAADGRLDEIVEFPASKVTSCAFGGPELRDLYVTTATFGMSRCELDAEPLAGALFRFQPGVAGRPANLFQD